MPKTLPEMTVKVADHDFAGPFEHTIYLWGGEGGFVGTLRVLRPYNENGAGYLPPVVRVDTTFGNPCTLEEAERVRDAFNLALEIADKIGAMNSQDELLAEIEQLKSEALKARGQMSTTTEANPTEGTWFNDKTPQSLQVLADNCPDDGNIICFAPDGFEESMAHWPANSALI